MKHLNKILLFVFAVAIFGCNDDDINDLSAIDAITAPSNVGAIFDVTQDNSGLVTIIPQAENVASFRVLFGDMMDEIPTEFELNETIEHIYSEGVFTVTITAVSLNGLTTTITEELNVTFKSPENLVVTVTQDVVNPRMISVSGVADFATVMEVYFGDVDPETPTMALPGEVVNHTYESAGEYTIRVIAKSAGAASTAYTEVVIVPDAADPIAFPIDFESFTINYAFGNFGNAFSTVIDNPDASGINTSDKVGQLIKSAGAEDWAGSLLTMGEPIDFSSKKLFYVKVWSPKVGAVVKFKVENKDDNTIGHEVDAITTVTNEWEELVFDFSDINLSETYQNVVLFFDFGNAVPYIKRS